MKKLLIISLWLSLTSLEALAAPIVQKSALIIANTAYAQSPLDNPANDAQLVNKALNAAGFNTAIKTNLSRSQLFKSITRFSRSLKPGAIGLVYYAGHGIQLDRANYLLPVDIKVSNAQSIKLNAYPLDNMIKRLKYSKAAVTIVILDSCRDNPFLAGPTTRGLRKLGLYKVTAPKGMLIAYSTQPGAVALDGQGEHSIYAQALAGTINQQGLTIEQIFNQVAATVRQQSNDQQQPLIETSIVDSLYLNPPEGISVIPPKHKTVVKTLRPNVVYRQIHPTTATPIDINTIQIKHWPPASSGIYDRQNEFIRIAKNASNEEVTKLLYLAENNDENAMTAMGYVYKLGFKRIKNANTGKTYPYEPDLDKSMYWFKQAANYENPIAKKELGIINDLDIIVNSNK